MRYLALLCLAMFAASCSAPNDSSVQSTAPADQYFYPPTNGLQYVYSLDSASALVDTSTYQVVVGTTYDSYAKLISNTASPAGSASVLYYYKVDESQAGIKCILSTTGSDGGIIALEGSLDVGSSWTADADGYITATVVGHYAQYFLPGRQQVYSDVVAVQYNDSRVSDSSFVLRIFARDYGMILERTVYPNSQVSNLQLLNLLSSTPNGIGNPTHHDHWYDLHGRFAVAMDPAYDR